VSEEILVIDDNREFTEMISGELRRRGHPARVAHSGAAGLACVRARAPRLILLDLHLVDMSGLDVLTEVRQLAPAADVVIVTAFPELSSALAAIRQKAVDYLCKPFAWSELDAILTRVFPGARPPAPSSETSPAPTMVGDSAATRELAALIGRLAETGVRAALITGESGTGKDLAARLFHAQSRRHAGPFIEVNCSAITETLFESELFGHERGAFTGAVSARRGLVEMADGGTLFLDEVAEIPLASQPKLLRFLEDQTFMRVGGSKKIRVDVQIIAATNRDVRAMVEQWAFRPDLYFRLNVVPIVLPPLRERREDIAPLLRFWLEDANERYGKQVSGFTPAAEAALLEHPWPGNVRELRNLVERLVILARGPRIDVGELPTEYRAPAVLERGPVRGDSLEEHERAHIRRVLARVDGNKTRAAELLGISRHTLRLKLNT
jgi:DNA-binding NtrC family response regulator